MPDDVPRFYEDECDIDGCPEPVVTIICDRVKDIDTKEIIEKNVLGLCREHKRDPKTEEVFSPDSELPF